jgi:hypothetical protein
MDQAIEDITDRLKPREKMVFDVSHSFLCRHYSIYGKGEHAGLDLLLTAMSRGERANDYSNIEAAAPSIAWVHLNDCTATPVEREGLPLFRKDSLVDWGRMIALLKKMDVPMILEIGSAEKDFSLLETSFRNFQNMWAGANHS